MTNHPNRNTKDYPHLRAWNRMMGSAEYYCEDTLRRARQENAPVDAVYRSHKGRWVPFSEVQRADTRMLIERLVSEMERAHVNVNIPKNRKQ